MSLKWYIILHILLPIQWAGGVVADWMDKRRAKKSQGKIKSAHDMEQIEAIIDG